MFFKTEIVFVRILLPFSIGILFFYFFAVPFYIPILYVACASLFCLLLAFNILYKRFNIHQIKGLVGGIIFLFLFCMGGLLCLLNNKTLDKQYFANHQYPYLQIIVNDEPQQSKHLVRFKADVVEAYTENRGNKVTGKLLITLKLDSVNPINIQYGDQYIIQAKYLPVEPPHNPAEFDYKAWMAQQSIYHQTFINQNQLIKIGQDKGNKIINFAQKLRQQQVKIYRNLIHQDEAFAVASTLVLGYRADLSKETLATYSATGTIHALSVSGAHVAIIYYILNLLLSFLNRNKKTNVLKVILICTLIWAYAILTGLSPATLRSAIMISIYIIAQTFNKNTNNYNILAFSAFVMLVYHPFLIWDVGFQLSYLAVFGLIYLQPKIYHVLYIKNKWLDKFWNLVALSLAAQMITFPLSIYYFHQFPLYFLFSNLFITIPLILMMYLGVAILVPYLGFMAPLFEWVIKFTNSGLKWISNLPFASLSAIWMNTGELILLSVALGLLIYAVVNGHKKLLFASLFVLIGFESCMAYDKIMTSRQRKIIFFSMRKHYASAFISGHQAILVTDLSEKDKNYSFFVKPYLDDLKIENIHFVHYNQDTVIHHFVSKEHQISFFKYKILLSDSTFNFKTIHTGAKFQVLWIHQNAKLKLSDFAPRLKPDILVMDASNENYTIKRYQTQAYQYVIESRDVKHNQALEIRIDD